MLDFVFIFLAVVFVFLNAFFVAAEFGMVKIRGTKVQEIKKKYGIRGVILGQVHKHLDAYLSACQLGITLASLGLGWIGEPAFAHLLEPVFKYFQITSPEVISVSAFVVAFSVISFLHIVIGELMPKSLAIRQSEAVSVWTAVPLYGFYWMMYPAIWILNTCSNMLLKIFNLDASHRAEHFYSTEEIQHVLHASHVHGELTKDETEIMEQTLEFADLKVTEVMRPTEELVMLDIQQPIRNILSIAAEHRYSRYPVYDSGEHEILGVVHVKDLFKALFKQKDIENLRPCIRPISRVSHLLPAINLLRKFREGMPHLALVYKNRELLGFVTFDNLLHVLIGRIQDEFHKTIDDWIKNPDGSLTVKGKCSVFSLERGLDYDLMLTPEQEEIDTVSNLIINQLGKQPRKGQKISFPEFDAVIRELRKNQIQKIRVYPKPINRE
ncbi:MAG TPA: hypothetical protein DD381_12825 [Lentisphaeria bacterium]|nr:MAG: hypothetical protein A2X47_12395 [Lentisphaerae bacterium GWF2_38_69]HBM17208.1 hypothetical protein [Lentisphaeria bacterium]